MLSPVNGSFSITWREGTEEYQKTYSTLHHRPSTRKLVGEVLRRFEAFVVMRLGADAKIADVGLVDLEHYQAFAISEMLAIATVNKHLRTIRGFLRWCSYRGWTRDNPTRGMRLIKESERDPRTLSKEEIETLRTFLVAEDPLLYDLFRIGLNTGGRLGEVLWLERKDVDLEASLVKFRNSSEHPTKGGYSREVSINDSVKETIERRLASGARWLFVSRYGRPYDGSTISARFSRTCEAAGLEGVSFQALRRTFGTEMAQRLQPAQLMKIMGHRHINVTMQFYVNLSRFDQPAVPVLV